jgi:LysM repeat protein
MKKRMSLAVILGAIMLSLVMMTATQTKAQDLGPNLFQNPGFEEGHYNQDGIAEIAVPNGWRMHWLDGVAFEGTEGRLAYRPETVVWNVAGAPPNEADLFWKDGIYTLKIFKSWAPMYAALSQDVSGLEVGRRYRVVAPVYIDVYIWDNGKVAPEDPTDAKVRLGAGPVGAPWRDASQINYSAWYSGASVQPWYQAYPIFVWDFTATAENMTVWIEVQSDYPHPNNGFFMDALGLYALDEVDNNVNAAPAPSNGGSGSAAPAPAPAVVPTLAPVEVTPNPDGSITHVVQSGDTLWTIAIRYAPVLGITPEEALPQIRELNNDPAFISVGDELLIKAPGEPLPAEEAPAEEAPAAETTTEEAPAAETTAEEAPAEEAPAEEQPQPELISEPAPSAICVTAFDDANGDGMRQADAEGLLANTAISLFRSGTTVATYVSDGVSEPYCFQDLEADTYQVQVFPPADYVASGAATWAVAVSDGAQIPVEFGVQYSPAQPVEQPTEGPNINETAAPATPEAPAAESGGLFSGVGGIILAVVVFLVLLLGVGVFLVRRG